MAAVAKNRTYGKIARFWLSKTKQYHTARTDLIYKTKQYHTARTDLISDREIVEIEAKSRTLSVI